MEIHVVELEPMRLAAIPHRGSYQSIGEAFGLLHGWQESSGFLHGPLVAVYYDDPHQVPEPDLRSEAGVVIQGDAPISGDQVHEVKIPGGQYAMASYRGDYSGLAKAWEEFYTQGTIPAGLKTKADACFERYINTPMDSAPEDLITELYAPLA